MYELKNLWLNLQAYLGLCQTSITECLTKTVNGKTSELFLQKPSAMDVWQGHKYVLDFTERQQN